MELELNKIYNEDCLGNKKLGTGMWRIPDKSVDLICCDPPFGTTSCKWDSVIPFDKLWEQYSRIIKDDGAIVLFAQQPFTSSLIMSNVKFFKYTWIWQKNNVGGVFNAKNRPLKIFEDIAVFSKAPAANVKGTKMKYYPQGLKDVEISRINDKRRDNETFGKRPSRKGEYTQNKSGYPKDILQFDCERNGLHPTQKPVSLIEYLIKTYTNEGETVLDNCMGSGTTAIACLNTNRNYIGFELDEGYYNKSLERIKIHIENFK